MSACSCPRRRCRWGQVGSGPPEALGYFSMPRQTYVCQSSAADFGRLPHSVQHRQEHRVEDTSHKGEPDPNLPETATSRRAAQELNFCF